MNAEQLYSLTLDGNKLPAGMYIYRVTTDDMYYNGRIVLINK